MRWCEHLQQGGSTSVLPKATSAGSEGTAPGTFRVPVLISPESPVEEVKGNLRLQPVNHAWGVLGDSREGGGCQWGVSALVYGVFSVHNQEYHVKYWQFPGPSILLAMKWIPQTKAST